ncbi:MAG: MFS transporter [Actinobacteria bacterium 69-20]|jgi:Na+/melibiose symporter-like transporter|nr:MFS transporter [Actinomycetota bacterium]OJV30085.1 MAG: MFS transporter [Actinobacteria bacterium 69-20]
MTERLPTRVRIGYAAGSLATGAFGTVPGLLLLPYLTDTIGIGAALAGVLVLLPKAWDVVFNPVAGRLSDRTTGPRGPRRPYLLYAGLGTAILFALMFAHPSFGRTGVAIWVVVLFLATATTYALYQVPYVALPTEMTSDPAERTRLMTRRIAVLAIAILISGAGAPAIRDAAGGVNGYRLVGLAVGGLIAIGAVWAFLGTARAPIGTPRPSAVGWRQTVAAVRSAPRFARLWIVFVIQAVGIGTMLAGVDYLARVVLGSAGMSSVLFAAFVAPALLVMPLWQLAAARYSKVACYVAASVLFAAGALGIIGVTLFTSYQSFIAVSIIGPNGEELNHGTFHGPPTAVVIALVVIIGIGYAGQQVFPLSLLADISAEAETESGGKRAGVFAGVWTAGETFGLALGPGIYGIVLAIGGYLSATAANRQPMSAAMAIAVGFTVIPAVCVLVALPLLRRVSTSTREAVKQGR